MKKTHLIILLFLVCCIAVITGVMYRSDSYSSFDEAAASGGKTVQVIGTLVQPPLPRYDTISGTRYFVFRMKDHKGTEADVRYRETAPRDFEKLEEIVVTGVMGEKFFEAESMLLKCPSKYNDEKQPEGYENKAFGKQTQD